MALATQWASELTGGAEPVARPYVWPDVAAVHLLCAAPLALLVARWIALRGRTSVDIIMAFVFLAVSAALGIDVVQAALVHAEPLQPVLSMALRAAAALGWIAAAALAGGALCRRPLATAAPSDWPMSRAIAGVMAALWLVVPATYVAARCRNDLSKLASDLEQNRFADAQILAQRLLALDASQHYRGQPLRAVVGEIDNVVAALEAQVALAEAGPAASAAPLNHARNLAMLGRADRALEVLNAIDERDNTVDIDRLRAAIHEHQSDWAAALACYGLLAQACQSQPDSEARRAALAAAVRGIAYCQRKSGNYGEAEAAYRQLLAIEPTADAHFLVAQFYEDAQQAEAARLHAAKAMELAPERYASPARELIQKLSVHQFGCLGVFRAESAR
jgi:tetratricopeptide (TPR) repeat protein